MALHEFWSNVRIGAKVIAPQVSVAAPRLDAERIESQLVRAHLWLTPRSVAGYDAGDFTFLDTEEQQRLSECVERFLAVARAVPPATSATKAQVEAALPPFRGIVEVLGFDRYGDAEAYRIGKQVERRIRADRPPWMTGLWFETGSDVSGDPALWVWVIVQDEAAEGAVGAPNAKTARVLLDAAAREVAPGRWPYIRFQTVSEQAELAEVG